MDGWTLSVDGVEKQILESFPDWAGERAQSQVTDWLAQGAQELGAVQSGEFALIRSPSLLDPLTQAGVACFSDSLWRKWVLGLYLADLVSYPRGSDQVDFQRLTYVTSTFPNGFTLACLKLNGRWWPAGYTGWYPISQSQFDVLVKSPERMDSRMVLPQALISRRPYLYLFNYSVKPGLNKTAFSKTMMRAFAASVQAMPAVGLCAITVSGDGERIAKRFGMAVSGEFKIGRDLERVYSCRVGHQF